MCHELHDDNGTPDDESDDIIVGWMVKELYDVSLFGGSVISTYFDLDGNEVQEYEIDYDHMELINTETLGGIFGTPIIPDSIIDKPAAKYQIPEIANAVSKFASQLALIALGGVNSLSFEARAKSKKQKVFKILVDQPGRGGDRDIAEKIRGKVEYGHVWIELWDGTNLKASAGFYPKDPEAITPTNPSMQGEVRHDNNLSRKKAYDVSASWVIDSETFQYLLDRLNQDHKDPPRYHVQEYNCVNWAIDVASLVDEAVGSITDSEWNKNNPNSKAQPHPYTIKTRFGEFPFRFPGLTPGHFGEDLIDELNINSTRRRPPRRGAR